MLTETRERLFDLLRKNAPILFIQAETGLTPTQIVKFSYQTKNDTKNKANRQPKSTLKISFKGKNRAFRMANLPGWDQTQSPNTRKQPTKVKTRKGIA